MPILARAPRGAVVSVGSERVLFDALMMPDPTEIIAIDFAEDIVKFHMINATLIKACVPEDISTYFQLRTQPTKKMWQEFSLQALQSGRIGHDEYSLLADINSHTWWAHSVAHNKQWHDFHTRGNTELVLMLVLQKTGVREQIAWKTL